MVHVTQSSPIRRQASGPVSQSGAPKDKVGSTPPAAEKYYQRQRNKQQSGRGNNFSCCIKIISESSYVRSSCRASATAPAMPFNSDDGWTDDNYQSSSEPGNDVGAPTGAPLDGGAGKR